MRSKQSSLWLLAAIAAPAAHFSGCGWFTVLITSALLLPFALVPKDWAFPKPVAIGQILWLGIVAGVLLPGSAACWPSDNAIAVPLTLLSLASLTRSAYASRVGAVLALSMGLLALPIVGSGAAHGYAGWLKPTPWSREPMLALVLLLPALPAGGAKKGRDVAAAGLLVVLLAALIQGVLSPAVAGSLADPEYQTARTLGYLEPVAASALTLGWYAAASWLFTASSEIARNSQMGQRLPYVLLWGTAATVILLEMQLSAQFLMVLSGFLWCFAPFFQKLKKVKNRA